MNLNEFQASIEIEKAWREEDIRFYNNLMAKLDTSEQLRMRKSIICILYAHIEGFVYYTLSLYIESINNLDLKCKDVKPAIAAAALSDAFTALKNPDRKNDLFKRKFPDDTKLHRICREMEFIENSLSIQNKTVRIPKKFINTESNVGPDILRKLLYQLGLNYVDFENLKDDLNQLLVSRNNVAHGKIKDGISEIDYQRYKDCFHQIFSRLSNLMVMAYANRDYLISS